MEITVGTDINYDNTIDFDPNCIIPFVEMYVVVN
jgi:hypothetical protein